MGTEERLMSSLSKFFSELGNKGGAENNVACCVNVFRDLLCCAIDVLRDTL
jgi:hypothetical protein